MELDVALANMNEADAKFNSIIITGSNNKVPIELDNVVYEDKAYPLLGKRLSTNVGKVDYDWGELTVKFQPNGNFGSLNDHVGMVTELPHQAVVNGKIYPHIHWEQTSADAVVWELQYRIQDNGNAKTTSWSSSMTATSGELAENCDNVFDYVSGTLIQISRFKDGSGNYYIDLDGIDISATIQFRLARTDSNSGNVYAEFFDFHYQIDDMGSKTEFNK